MDDKTKARGLRAIEAIDQQIGLIRDDFTDGKFEDAQVGLDELLSDVARLRGILDDEPYNGPAPTPSTTPKEGT